MGVRGKDMNVTSPICRNFIGDDVESIVRENQMFIKIFFSLTKNFLIVTITLNKIKRALLQN